MSNDTNYESKAITTQIRATSRASVKVRDNYYTVEYTEERTIPQIDDVDIAKEREILWDCVNNEVDNQIEDIIKSFAKQK
jgi:CRISPR/Cas system CSM-associated protein Csm3 (group 7 of RAMP superfamily)